MVKKGRKWLWGCGIGCGVMIVASILISLGVSAYIKNMFHGIHDAEQSQEQLEEDLGVVEDFVPAADGSIAPDRMEIFLAVRDSLRESAHELENALAGFDPDQWKEEDQGPRALISKALKGVGGLINPIGKYVDYRNRLLLGAGMSIGEYVYIYSIAYYSYLGHDPLDEVEYSDVQFADRSEGLSVFQEGESTLSPSQVQIRYRRYFLAQMENQLNALTEGDQTGTERQTHTELVRELTREIERFEIDRDRVAWSGDLPTAIEQSVKPYHDLLEATYYPISAGLEFPMQQKGWQSWVQVE